MANENWVKSYSNYVIRKKHQDIDGGEIYERDFSTIGGINRFALNGTPIYQHGNFVITVNNEPTYKEELDATKWYEPTNSNQWWTIDEIEEVLNGVTEDTTKIELKSKSQKLQDYAYYGSCAELVRASLNNIISNYPGELYYPTENLVEYYADTTQLNDVDGSRPRVAIGNTDYTYIMDNPFDINIHSTYVSEEEISNPLRYFANEGWKNYEVYSGSTLVGEITNWSVDMIQFVEIPAYLNVNASASSLKYDGGTVGLNIDSQCASSGKTCFNVGDKMGTVTISVGTTNYEIGVFKGYNDKVLYLPKNTIGRELHIKPKAEIINEVFNNFYTLEKVLLDRDSTPMYTALFEVMTENSFGYVTTLEKFTFPKSYGDWNLAINNISYQSYLTKLSNLALFYDELYCDNIYRSMTHEAIKNFDWTYEVREQNDEESITIGSARMQKGLRLIGREFDELKLYIDGIINSNNITYSDKNNVADYFLTDVLNSQGITVTNVYPLTMTVSQQVSDGEFETLQPSNSGYTNENNYRTFADDMSITVKPYSLDNISGDSKYGYYLDCRNSSGDTCLPKSAITISDIDNIFNGKIVSNGNVRSVFKVYSSDKEYSMNDANNIFLKNLSLNAKHILNKKGTLQGIESMLSLFGLRSKRFCETAKEMLTNTTVSGCSLDNPYNNIVNPDYNICEHYAEIDEAIEDKWVGSFNMNRINLYNYSKTITYHNMDSVNGIYHAYQGLPVQQFVNVNNKLISVQDCINQGITLKNKSRILYPYFNQNFEYDGGTYYQMDGGWLHKRPFQFNTEGQLINYESTAFTNTYTETLKSILTVNDLNELFSLSVDKLHNGIVVKVNKNNEVIFLLDGKSHVASYDSSVSKYYITASVSDSTITVGGHLYKNYVTVYDENGSIQSYNLSLYANGHNIRIYQNGNSVICYNDTNNLSNSVIISGNSDQDVYYRLGNILFKSEFDNELGWQKLLDDDLYLKHLKSVETITKGNNPHYGHLAYDGGYEYISRFRNLFKIALADYSFNINCYPNDNDYYEALDNIINWANDTTGTPMGFEFLDNDDNVEELDNCLKLYPTKKVCDGETKIKSYAMTFSNSGNTTPDEIEQHKIINTKVIDIEFYIYQTEGSPDYFEEIKYYDTIVMNYLTQVIPSSAIVNIIYTNK